MTRIVFNTCVVDISKNRVLLECWSSMVRIYLHLERKVLHYKDHQFKKYICSFLISGHQSLKPFANIRSKQYHHASNSAQFLGKETCRYVRRILHELICVTWMWVGVYDFITNSEISSIFLIFLEIF